MKTKTAGTVLAWLASLPPLFAAPSDPVIIAEDFAAHPEENGWKTFGQSLFEWNAAEGNLKVTWDSSRENSYFYLPLHTILAKADDFSAAFDLKIEQIQVGLTPEKPFAFQIAAGFLNLAEAAQTNFRRGTGLDSPNLCEFNYFPDSGFGATISPVMVSANGQFAAGFTFPLELSPGEAYRIEMNYSAEDRTLRTQLTRNGEPFAPIDDVVLPSDFSDVRLDAFSISSYSDIQSDGSLLARGEIDNVLLVLPRPPVEDLTGDFEEGIWQVTFKGRNDWSFVLERTTDFKSWSAVADPVAGTGEWKTIEDRTSEPGKAFYRIRAERP